MSRSARVALAATIAASLGLLLTASGASAVFGPATSFGSLGAGSGQMDSPGGMAVAGNGDVYVADSQNDRIDVFSASGEFMYAFGKEVNAGSGDPDLCTSACQAGKRGMEAGAFWSPADVAFGADDTVLVTNWGGFRVDIFTMRGEFLAGFGKDVNPTGFPNDDFCTAASGCQQGSAGGAAGSVSNSYGIATDNGRVYVSGGTQNRVNVYTESGMFLYAFGEGVNAGGGDPDKCEAECQTGSGDAGFAGIDYPFDVLVKDKEVFVTDQGNSRVDVFSTEGDFLRAFGYEVNPAGGNVCTIQCAAGLQWPKAGAIEGPAAIARDAAGDLYITDYELLRVSQFKPDGTFVRAFGGGVVDGADAFQVCIITTECQKGVEGSFPGAVSEPFGAAFSGSHLLVSEGSGPFSVGRIESFGEVTPAPPTPPTPTPTPTPAPIIPPPPSPPSNRVGVGKLALDMKKGTATLSVRVPGPGALKLAGKGVKQVKATAKKAGKVSLLVELVGSALKELNETGKATVKPMLTYTPSGGTARSVPRTLTLRMAPPKG